MENNNTPSLVKSITMEDGSKKIICSYAGADCCHTIHSDCVKCPVMQKIIETLNTYESIIIASGNKEYVPLTQKNDDGSVVCRHKSPNIYSAIIGSVYAIEEAFNE